MSTRFLPLKATGSRKLLPLWIGPYRVEAIVNENAYRLTLPLSLSRIHPVVNVSQLKRYRGTIIPPPDPVLIDGLEEYEVEHILAHRRIGRRSRLEFLVSFVGYDDGANEWLPEANLEHASELLTAYKTAHGL